MITIDLSDKNVLITGGTKGIGLASGVEFGRAGAQVFLTYKWGSANQDDIRAQFAAAGARAPMFFEADASVDTDTEALMNQLAVHAGSIDVLISNVGIAQRTMSLDDYKKKSLFKSLEYCTWPLVEYTRRIKSTFGHYPAHILGISSSGPDHFFPGYDFVAGAKGLLEIFARYLSVHLAGEGSRVNVVRFGMVPTESFELYFGSEFLDFLRASGVPDDLILTPEQCGRTVLAVCSGLLNALNGQIITVDHGLEFKDNLMVRYMAQKETGRKENHS